MKKFIALLVMAFGFPVFLVAQTVSTPQPVTTMVSSALTNSQVAVSNVSTLIAAQSFTRKSLIVRNQGMTDMYIGGTSVSASNGLLVKAGEVLIIDRSNKAIYGIVSSGTTTAGYLEE